MNGRQTAADRQSRALLTAEDWAELEDYLRPAPRYYRRWLDDAWSHLLFIGGQSAAALAFPVVYASLSAQLADAGLSWLPAAYYAPMALIAVTLTADLIGDGRHLLARRNSHRLLAAVDPAGVAHYYRFLAGTRRLCQRPEPGAAR